MFMPKQPLSVTLDRDNLLWLRGRADGRKRKSLSDALDEIITAARLGGLCAAARDLNMPLLTRDAAIRESGTVRVVW
jgi:hypothetical protein